MDTLRLAFLVIGGIAIVGIVVHGMWSVRKNTKDSREAHLETSDWNNDYDDIEEIDSDVIVIDPDGIEEKREPSLTDNNFDDLGLGAVRVVGSDSNSTDSFDAGDTKDTENAASSAGDTVGDVESHTDLSLDAEKINSKQQESAAQPKIYSSVVTQPKPEYAAQQVQAMRSKSATSSATDSDDIPEPPPFLLKTGDVEIADPSSKATHTTTLDANQIDNKAPPVEKEPVQQTPSTEETIESSGQPEAKVSLADQARNFVKGKKAEPKTRKRREPKIREDQMRIDFDEPMESDAQTPPNSSKSPTTDDTEMPAQEQEVLILNVKAADDSPIQGAALLPMLLTLGFKFGDQDIFHRHVNSNGKGPVLFSLANMFKPGVFDIDNLENFNTMGVSLFMMLPIEGDPHQVFNMMHNAARKIADEFSAQVLDGRRSALTKQSLQQYVEKIREFERRRMIAK